MRHIELHEQSGEVWVKIGRDGGFVIPVACRQALGIKAGDEIVMSWKDDELCITKASRPRRNPRQRARR